MLVCEKPIIRKVRGRAYGLGVNILSERRYRFIAAENARFCDSHVKKGIAPGDAGAVLWPFLIGFHRAKEYVMLGDPIDAKKAADIGLINYCVADQELDGFVDEMANKLANGAPPRHLVRQASVNVMLEQIMAGASNLHGLRHAEPLDQRRPRALDRVRRGPQPQPHGY